MQNPTGLDEAAQRIIAKLLALPREQWKCSGGHDNPHGDTSCESKYGWSWSGSRECKDDCPLKDRLKRTKCKFHAYAVLPSGVTVHVWIADSQGINDNWPTIYNCTIIDGTDLGKEVGAKVASAVFQHLHEWAYSVAKLAEGERSRRKEEECVRNEAERVRKLLDIADKL
jgi:hypothetical protein